MRRRAHEVDNANLRMPSRLDVLTLAAVVLAGGAIYACGWTSVLTSHFSPDESVFIVAFQKGRQIFNSALPVGFGLAIVGVARVLREPRETRRQLFLQPGVAACAAMLAALIVASANMALSLVRWIEFQEQSQLSGFVTALWPIAASHASFSVLAVWIYLALGGLWASGRNWVNWLGGALGVLVVLNALLWCLP